MNRLDYILASLRRAAENGYSWSVSPDEATALVAEVERLRGEAAQEREAERAAVVAWLRDEVDDDDNPEGPLACVLAYAANAIERGVHRREETE